MWSQKPPGAISDIVNFKIFLGEHVPRPPSLSMLPHTIISPLYRKILYKTLQESAVSHQPRCSQEDKHQVDSQKVIFLVNSYSITSIHVRVCECTGMVCVIWAYSVHVCVCFRACGMIAKIWQFTGNASWQRCRRKNITSLLYISTSLKIFLQMALPRKGTVVTYWLQQNTTNIWV